MATFAGTLFSLPSARYMPRAMLGTDVGRVQLWCGGEALELHRLRPWPQLHIPTCLLVRAVAGRVGPAPDVQGSRVPHLHELALSLEIRSECQAAVRG